ncbi:MAG: hypothetical protein R3E55_07085 [Burkholderiaceae bacterium]
MKAAVGGGALPHSTGQRVAAATGDKAQHIRNRGFDNRYYRFIDLVREHQPVSREDINKLLLNKLPEVLSSEQKASRVHNLLTSRGKRIKTLEPGRLPSGF